MNFEVLKSQWDWQPIRNCPGRFILRDQNAVGLSPEKLVDAGIKFSEYRTETAKDTVLVAQISDSGLISYRRNDGSYLHTLNTVAGFERKLANLDIELTKQK